MPIFTDLLQNTRDSKTTSSILKPGSFDARDWYREKAREVVSMNPNKIISQNKSFNRTMIQPGFMYLFGYNPKMKDELPFYDRYPLIFPFKSEEGGFMGMNLHYLPHIMRARLMDQLYELTNNDRFDRTTKLRASYALLSSASRYKYFKPCVKRYLYSHVQTNFLFIPANEWDIALFLPLERFEKQNKGSVFKDSRFKINAL
jgi:hypothetical protein